MKKSIVILIMLMLFSSVSFGLEEIVINEDEVETSVKFNDVYLASDTHHILKDGTVFVVGKYLVDAIGGTIEWHAETQTAVVTLGVRVVELTIGSTEAIVDGNIVQLSKAPYLKDGRTMIPLKLVAEYFGSTVTWDQKTYTVYIKNDLITVPEELIYNRPYTDEDLYLLSKIVTVESGDQSLQMALAIANTVMNRVKDSRFPNTIEGVIYQVDRYKQFPPAHKESFKTLEPKYISTIAAKRALEGVNNIEKSLYFNNQPFKTKANDLIKIIDGEYFYN